MRKIIILLLCLSTFQSGFAFSSDLDGKRPRFRLSVDSLMFKRFSSQEATTDAAFSLASGIDHLHNTNPGIISWLLSIYGGYTVALWNHEITGHVVRGKEFDAKISGLHYKGPFSAAVSFAKRATHIQQNSIIDTGGVEASYLLSQKITKQTIRHDSTITPAIGVTYILSSMDQFGYVMKRVPSDNNSGNDIRHYINYAQSAYGADAITVRKIRSVAWIDLLDPMLFASIYSVAAYKPIEPPMLDIGAFKFMPALKLVLTPYGVLEKRLVTYFKTPERMIKVSLGFGREQKTTVLPTNMPLYGYVGELPSTGNLTAPKLNNTYFAEVSVDKVISFDDLDLGFTAAMWSQPKLFTLTPYTSPTKLGGMLLVNANLHYSKDMDVFMDFGYKQQGYVLGQPTKATSILRVGLDWRV